MERKRLFNLVIWVTGLSWTLVVFFSCLYSISREKELTLEMAKKEAVTTFSKDRAFRKWATRHGGVYVPVTDETPPNPYLSHIPERDILTPSGRKLTLMNPAYMLRQMMHDYEDFSGTKGHITSLRLLNPGNKPDAWERKALKLLSEEGREEVLEIDYSAREPYLRLMRPMITKEECLKCHGMQGYKVGDVSGGVGVAVALAPYLEVEDRIVSTLTFSYASIWLIGLMALSFFSTWGKRRLREQVAFQERLLQSHEGLQTIIDSIDSLIYVAAMDDHEIVMVNKYGRKLFGELQGKKCWQYFQRGQNGPCSFCTNNRLVDENGRPLGTYAWESQNTITGRWYDCRDKAMLWIDGRLVRIQIATDITEKRLLAEEKENLINRLQKAVDEIKTLRGIIPICSYCKNIRDDAGAWKQMEIYIRDNSNAEFSHGICPDCLEKMKKSME